MLTGGLNVMGMFVQCTSDDFKTSQSKYKQVRLNVALDVQVINILVDFYYHIMNKLI